MKYKKQINEYLKIFPVTAITGQRQSGKSTFVKHNLKDKYKYVTFDDPLLIDFFHNDPKGFMEQYNNHVIFNEVQKVPEIFSKDRENYGKYVITGSSQFSMLRHVSESLVVRDYKYASEWFASYVST